MLQAVLEANFQYTFLAKKRNQIVKVNLVGNFFLSPQLTRKGYELFLRNEFSIVLANIPLLLQPEI